MFKVIFGYIELTFSLSSMGTYIKKNQRQEGLLSELVMSHAQETMVVFRYPHYVACSYQAPLVCVCWASYGGVGTEAPLPSGVSVLIEK